MSKAELINKATRAFHKVGFALKKHSPEIMVVAGVAGTVTSAVMACKATTKLSGILEDAKDQIDTIHECASGEVDLPEPYTEEDGKKDLAIVYVQTGLKLIKLYGPAVVLGAASITSILAGHNITRKRNAALSAAYIAVDKGFKEYRGRVVERFGEELDKELRYNIKAKEVDTIVVDENGNETIEKKTVQVSEGPSIYARIYDDGCNGWSKDPERNLLVLRSQEAFANQKLQKQGYLFLNEVYEMLGFAKTSYGQQVGWIYDEKNPNGDNVVDFGIYDIYNEANRRFVNGYERNILLDFNVDGPILDLM